MCSLQSKSVLFGRARERKRKRKGALYDDDVNDDDVLRDDDDDAKKRPAYATRADDAAQSAPEYSGDGGGAFRCVVSIVCFIVVALDEDREEPAAEDAGGE